MRKFYPFGYNFICSCIFTYVILKEIHSQHFRNFLQLPDVNRLLLVNIVHICPMTINKVGKLAVCEI